MQSARFKILPFFFFFLCCGMLWGQDQGAGEESKKKVDIIYNDSSEVIQSGGNFIRKLIGTVELRMDSVFFYCDSAIIENDAKVWAYGNIIIQQTDTISVFADSLEYDVEERTAILMGDTVILVNGTQQLYTNGLNYLARKVATYTTGATLYNEETQLSSKIGYYYVESKEAFFKDSVVVVDPQFSLRTDTLQFNTESRTVYFVDSTLISSDTSKIYCEGGYYDTENGLAKFTKNAQFQRGDQLGKADVIRYDQKDTSFTLIGNAFIEAPGQKARADTIAYQQNREIFSLSGNARFNDGARLVEADQVFYNAKNETYYTEGRSFISDPPQILQADRVDFSEEQGSGFAYGNVIWQDTSAELTIKCGQVAYDQKRDYLKASGGLRGRPLLITLVEGDTMFMAADTLLAVRADYIDELKAQKDSLQTDSLTTDERMRIDSLTSDSLANKELVVMDSLTSDSLAISSEPETDSLVQKERTTEKASMPQSGKKDEMITEDTLLTELDSVMTDSIALDSTALDSTLIQEPEKDTSRFLIAYRDVRIYKSNIQALADSMTYHEMDSIFTFFKRPVMWSDTTQMNADTIRIQMRNEAIDRVFLDRKAIIINARDDGYYNQIKGKNITAFFLNETIDRMHVEGNAESIYYGLDEAGAYVGVNKTACSEMMLYFKDNQVDRIKFLVQPQGVADPMDKADHNALRLEGFRWLYQSRPKSKNDLFVPKEDLYSKQ